MIEEWKEFKFGEFVQFPPKIKMNKEDTYSFIPMENLDGGFKYAKPLISKKKTGGGAKFEEGDTLFARITPCLQNGKIAQAKNLGGKPGFGSTEYFVFRGIKGVSDNDYIYYLSRTSKFRDNAINSMVGASGRQRADAGFIRNLKIKLPPLTTQKKIASIFSAYDNLVENNLKRIKLLEEKAQQTYEEWFSCMKFPGYKNIVLDTDTKLPEKWSIVKIGDIFTKLESGKRPKGGIDKSLRQGFASVGAENVNGIGRYDYSREKYITKEFFESITKGIIEDKDILIYKDGAYIGKTSMFQDNFPHIKSAVNEHVFLLNTGDKVLQNYLYFTLETDEYFNKMQNLNSNAAQPGINQVKLKSLEFVLPSKELLAKFNDLVEPITKKIIILAKQNKLLKEARDILLPRLMTGMINVDGIKFDYPKEK